MSPTLNEVGNVLECNNSLNQRAININSLFRWVLCVRPMMSWQSSSYLWRWWQWFLQSVFYRYCGYYITENPQVGQSSILTVTVPGPKPLVPTYRNLPVGTSMDAIENLPQPVCLTSGLLHVLILIIQQEVRTPLSSFICLLNLGVGTKLCNFVLKWTMHVNNITVPRTKASDLISFYCTH